MTLSTDDIIKQVISASANSDTFEVNVSSRSKSHLVVALALCFSAMDHVTHWRVQDGTLTLLWHEEPLQAGRAGPTALPFKMNHEGAVEFVWQWLKSLSTDAYGPSIDTDGSCSKGWNVKTSSNSWSYTVAEISPRWMVHSKLSTDRNTHSCPVRILNLVNKLLASYIRATIMEMVKDARVPNQLLDPEGSQEDKDKGSEGVEDVKEFAAIAGGAIAGYTAPLGVDPDKLGRKKNAPSRKKNKK